MFNPAPSPGTTKCLIITSFENSLWSDSNQTAMPHAKAALRKAVDTRFYVDGLGIATTNSSVNLIKDILKEMDGEVFDDQLLSSPAFQADLYGVKTAAYRRIIDYFDASATCTMVFDQAARRYVDAKAAGIASFTTIDTHVGLTPELIDEAEDSLDSQCICHAPAASASKFVFYEQ